LIGPPDLGDRLDSCAAGWPSDHNATTLPLPSIWPLRAGWQLERSVDGRLW